MRRPRSYGRNGGKAKCRAMKMCRFACRSVPFSALRAAQFLAGTERGQTGTENGTGPSSLFNSIVAYHQSRRRFDVLLKPRLYLAFCCVLKQVLCQGEKRLNHTLELLAKFVHLCSEITQPTRNYRGSNIRRRHLRGPFTDAVQFRLQCAEPQSDSLRHDGRSMRRERQDAGFVGHEGNPVGSIRPTAASPESHE